MFEVTRDLAKAEALFKSLNEPKRDEATLKADAVEAAAKAKAAAEAEAAKPRRIIVREPARGRASAAGALLERTLDRPDDSFRRNLADTLRKLGKPDPEGVPAATADPEIEERRRRRNAVAGAGVRARGSVDPTVVNAFKIRVMAPAVRRDGELLFVIEGDDIAQVTSDAMLRVAEFMARHHGGATWKMQSVERLPLALAPRA